MYLKGKKAIVPLCDRVIPIIEDDYVDIEFGTGCLKITPAHDQFVSRIFSVPKPNGKHRIILDLSALNKFLNKSSFRMEGLDSIKYYISLNCFMASIDLTDAFMSIPLHESSKKFVVFELNGVRYNFNVLPFGLTSAPRIFSKVLRPVIIYLRSLGIKITAYLDDFFIVNFNQSSMIQDLKFIINFLRSLGFKPNLDKSVLTPSYKILHLGYIWNSVDMTISLPEEKWIKTKSLAQKILKQCSLRDLSSFIGILVSIQNVFFLAPIHYRNVQIFFNKCLQSFKWNDLITLNSESVEDISWWSNCVFSDITPRMIKENPPDFTISTDSSNSGWGMSSPSFFPLSGTWNSIDSSKHINYLELKAVFLSIKSIAHLCENSHVHVLTDNVATKFYINKLGGTKSPPMCYLALDLWRLCALHKIMLSASYIPGVSNIEADFLSRASSHEYFLSQSLFDSLIKYWKINPEIDLFASSSNNKLPKFASLTVDDSASFHNAFSFSWKGFIYLFPPICLLNRVVDKFIRDDVDMALLITPLWAGLPVLPTIFDLLICNPLFIPASHLQGHLPLKHKFHLVAWLLSNMPAKVRAFQTLRSTTFSNLSQTQPSNLMNPISKNLPLGWLKAGIELNFPSL